MRVCCGKFVKPEAEVAEDSWSEVLHDDVALGNEVLDKLDALWSTKVERDVALTGVRPVEEGSPLPPVRLTDCTGAEESNPVGTLDRLTSSNVLISSASRGVGASNKSA